MAQNEIIWTRHSLSKIHYYNLSKSKVKSLLLNYDRKEQGIAPNTLALMKRVKKKRETEIWMMYEKDDKKIKIISAWRYPGKTKENESFYIPSDIFKEVGKR